MATDQLLLMGLSPPVEVDRGQVERGPVWMKETSWENGGIWVVSFIPILLELHQSKPSDHLSSALFFDTCFRIQILYVFNDN